MISIYLDSFLIENFDNHHCFLGVGETMVILENETSENNGGWKTYQSNPGNLFLLSSASSVNMISLQKLSFE